VSHILLTLIQERLKPPEVISSFLTDFYKDEQCNAIHFSSALARSQQATGKSDIQSIDQTQVNFNNNFW